MPVCSGPMSPRVALLSPFAFPSVRGNAVTVARVARGLRARGVELDVWDLSLRPEAAVEAGVDAFRAAGLPAFPAHRVGPPPLRLECRGASPVVLRATGPTAPSRVGRGPAGSVLCATPRWARSSRWEMSC